MKENLQRKRRYLLLLDRWFQETWGNPLRWDAVATEYRWREEMAHLRDMIEGALNGERIPKELLPKIIEKHPPTKMDWIRVRLYRYYWLSQDLRL